MSIKSKQNSNEKLSNWQMPKHHDFYCVIWKLWNISNKCSNAYAMEKGSLGTWGIDQQNVIISLNVFGSSSMLCVTAAYATKWKRSAGMPLTRNKYYILKLSKWIALKSTILVYSLIFVLSTESNQQHRRNVWHYTSFLWYPRALTIASHFPL